MIEVAGGAARVAGTREEEGERVGRSWREGLMQGLSLD